MENFNHALFLLLNASEHPSIQTLDIAIFFAEYAIWVIPALICIGWLRGSEATRMVLLEAIVSALVALLINQGISMIWQHPRPFVIGLGHTLIPHAADSSFPSDHLTLLLGVAFSLLMHEYSRTVGGMLALLGLPVAWARVYLGVHFPLDMLGAVSVAMLSAWLAFRAAPVYLLPAYRLATSIHLTCFGKFIKWGWVRR